MIKNSLVLSFFFCGVGVDVQIHVLLLQLICSLSFVGEVFLVSAMWVNKFDSKCVSCFRIVDSFSLV